MSMEVHLLFHDSVFSRSIVGALSIDVAGMNICRPAIEELYYSLSFLSQQHCLFVNDLKSESEQASVFSQTALKVGFPSFASNPLLVGT